MPRYLQSTRRLVPLDRLEEYLAGWAALRDSVARAGGRAWLFRATGRDDQFLEFLEWQSQVEPEPETSDPLRESGVAGALEALEGDFGPGHPELWEGVR